jgi:uncharacterized RDD family membrane protein YckC
VSDAVPTRQLASWWSRVWASLVDSLIAAAVVVFAGIGGFHGVQLVFTIIAIAAALLYPPVFMVRGGRYNGQTLGKQMLGIRVVRPDGEPIDFTLAVRRELLGKIALGLIPLYTIVDSLFPLGDQRRQAVHDKVAGTYVVWADQVQPGPVGRVDARDAEPEPETPLELPGGFLPPTSRSE